MSQFFVKNDPNSHDRLDYQILSKGYASLYLKTKILDADINWFKNEHYKVIQFNCKDWFDETEMHNSLKEKLNFPKYYGSNFNALDDCLDDVEFLDPGLVLVFNSIDSIEKHLATELLNTIANNSRKKLLFGERMLILTQVSDPSFTFPEIGACPVNWNDNE